MTVLDLTVLYPGPLATLLLAEQGARVIKVEPPGGDPVRLLGPDPGGGGAWHRFLNRGKESVVLDLKDPPDRLVGRALALRSDVVVEGFRPGVLVRLGLDPSDLLAERPDLVICSIPGFPVGSARRGRALHDLGFASLAGIVAQSGTPVGPPLVPGVQMVDVATGLRAAFTITAALFGARATGRGGCLEVSMLEAARILTAMASLAEDDGVAAPRGGGLLTGGYACYRIYACRDGRHLSVSALEPHLFVALCTALDLERFAADQLDPSRQELLAAALAARFAEDDRDAWCTRLGADTCVAPVLELNEAVPPPLEAVGRQLPAARPLDADGAAIRAELQAPPEERPRPIGAGR